MEVTIRVMSNGQEIDRIARPIQMDEGRPAVTYRKRLWPVINDCIYIDEQLADSDGDEFTWSALVSRLLPAPLSDQPEKCSKLLQSRFRDCLPWGIIQAVSSLTSLRLEQQARVLLVDFLRENHDAARLRRLLQMQLLFVERANHGMEKNNITASLHMQEQIDIHIQSETNMDWEWAPVEAPEKPEVDDGALRIDARKMQDSIGAYRAFESGAAIPEFDDLEGEQASIDANSESAGSIQSSKQDSMLVERTAKLGHVALNLLRYFADNPGDRAAHAEHVLGYPASDINRLILGRLTHYMKRSDSGGWECHPWTVDVLSSLDEV